MRINYKSDFEVDVTLELGGIQIPIPDNDFKVVFYILESKTYTCSYIGGVWTNCKKKDDNTLQCFLDNHKLGIGALRVEFYDYKPNADYSDGDKLTVTPKGLNIYLVNGPSDGENIVDATIPYDDLSELIRQVENNTNAITLLGNEIKEVGDAIPTKLSELNNDTQFVPRSVIEGLINSATQDKELKGYTAALPMTYDGTNWHYHLTPEMVSEIVRYLNLERQVWLKVSLNGIIEDVNNVEYVRLSKVDAVGSDVVLRGDGSVVTILCYTSTTPTENVEVEVMKTGDALEYAYKSELPTKVSDLSNDTGFITSSALEGYATEQYVDNIVGDINTALGAIIGE